MEPLVVTDLKEPNKMKIKGRLKNLVSIIQESDDEDEEGSVKSEPKPVIKRGRGRGRGRSRIFSGKKTFVC
jgi:hypothetical protein